MVSDFSLIDAIESGIVKVPRVPVSDDSMDGRSADLSRSVAIAFGTVCPRRAARPKRSPESPIVPEELEGALHSLYSNYDKYYRQWEQDNR